MTNKVKCHYNKSLDFLIDFSHHIFIHQIFLLYLLIFSIVTIFNFPSSSQAQESNYNIALNQPGSYSAVVTLPSGQYPGAWSLSLDPTFRFNNLIGNSSLRESGKSSVWVAFSLPEKDEIRLTPSITSGKLSSLRVVRVTNEGGLEKRDTAWREVNNLISGQFYIVNTPPLEPGFYVAELEAQSGTSGNLTLLVEGNKLYGGVVGGWLDSQGEGYVEFNLSSPQTMPLKLSFSPGGQPELKIYQQSYGVRTEVWSSDPPRPPTEIVDTKSAFTIPVPSSALKTESHPLSLQTAPNEFRSQVFPITLQQMIYGLSVTGQLGLRMTGVEDDPAAFARVVLIDHTTQHEYLIYEKSFQGLTSEEFNDPRPLQMSKGCEETCALPQPLNSFSLRLEVKHGMLAINEVSYVETPVAIDTEELRAKQNAVKIWQLNEQDLGWIAGETAVSNLSYEEKKQLTGLAGATEELNLQGFEYYRGGVFELKPTPATIRKRSNRTSALVGDFDWRSQHGEKWVTSVKDQKSCGSCAVFAATGAVEAVTNLYFNQHLDLDLAEQEVVSCSNMSGTGKSNCDEITGYNEKGEARIGRGWYPKGVINDFKNQGFGEEACFAYQAHDLACGNKCQNPIELIKVGGSVDFPSKYAGSSSLPKTEDTLKRLIIENGPVSGGILSLGHAMTLVGFETDHADGQTIWIFKNSWGTWWGADSRSDRLDYSYGDRWGKYYKEGHADNGYAYVKLEIDNIEWTHAVQTPITSKQPRQISCVDQDNDTYCNWGISKDKPSTCPASCQVQPDCDDSNPDLAVFDANYNCTGEPQPQPPIAMFIANPLKGAIPLQVTFDASGSSDPDGTIAIYEWTIDGQPVGMGNPFIYTFDQPGQFEVSLTVTDRQGLTATFNKIITVTGQFPPVANFIVSPSTITVAPANIALTTKGSYDLDGTITQYQWVISNGQTASGRNGIVNLTTPGSYTATLTVTDNDQLTGRMQKEIIVTANGLPVGTDCTQVTQIPSSECQALLALYHSANGSGWKRNKNWNMTHFPCNWDGVGCTNGHIYFLSLMDNNLIGTLPTELRNLSSAKMGKINLCKNQLTGPLPDLSTLTVTQLCLTNNQLSGHLPAGIPHGVLQLNLQNNQLTGPIPDAIARVPALNLANNHLCGEVPRSIMEAVASPAGDRFSNVHLSNNHLTVSDPEVVAYLDRNSPQWRETQTPGGDCAVAHCTYTITPTTASRSANSETGTLTVTAPADCSWTATSNANWITITSGSSGQGDGTVTYSVAGNYMCETSPCFLNESRSGTITIAGQTVTINQMGEDDCTYTITPTTVSHSANSETGTLTVTAPVGCYWKATSNAEWITITQRSSVGFGQGTVTYSVSDNTRSCISPDPCLDRIGTITVAEQMVTINQGATTNNVQVEVANPIVSQVIYQTGETLRVTLPSLPAGQEQYVGIGLPNGSLYLLNQLNSFISFNNVTFPVWPGGEVAIDRPITADLPSGLYTVYLLRMPTGVSPLSVKMEDWALGTAIFTVAS